MTDINLVNVSEDQECPFCRAVVKNGASVCSGCGAIHGTNSSKGAFWAFVILCSIAAFFSTEIGGKIISVLVFAGALKGVLSSLKPSWFRKTI